MTGIGAGEKVFGVCVAEGDEIRAIGVLTQGAVGAIAAAGDGADADALAFFELCDTGAELCDDAGGFVPRIARFHAVAAIGF